MPVKQTELARVVVLQSWATDVSLVPSRDVCENPQYLLSTLLLSLGSWLL